MKKRMIAYSIFLTALLMVGCGGMASLFHGPEPEKTPVPLEPPETYLIYGYDVINSGFINGGEVKRTMPVLSLDKLNAANMLVKRDTNQSKFSTEAGENIKEVYEKVGLSISAGVDFLVFSGKVSTEFEKSTFENQTHRYAKGIARHIVREEYLKNAAPSQIRNYLDDDFLDAIDNRSADYILDHYGTHLIARCYWGGSAEFNFSYYGSTLNNSNKVAAAVEAKYKVVSGSVSGSASAEVTELDNNSTFKYHTIGGNTTSFTSVESFLKGYSAWVDSITSKSELCGIDNFQQSFVPIWDLVADSAKAAAIRDKFTERAIKQGSLLGDWLNVKSATFTYNTTGNKSFSYPHTRNSAGEYFPARFDVYLVGGCGGGQGAVARWDFWIISWEGTGGAGGGGAASYLSFIATEAVTNIALSVGKGGSGGAKREYEAYGYPGAIGTASSAAWNGITITANGGKGGGTASSVTGGAGGTAADSIAGSKSVAGSPGDNGAPGTDGNKTTKGGAAGKIGNFGGAIGGNNTGNIHGSYGSGGAGAAWYKSTTTGGNGGDGLIQVVYYYYE
ncbi:MAG: hypothetical protein LBS64_00990 [Spirochaetaceae bacterium]|jgi:hypothetical protein|nr:hypothetical protein [Spirochaetaceae bacterium]